MPDAMDMGEAAWQRIAEEQVRLDGLEVAELDRIEQELRRERDWLRQELQVRQREIVLVTERVSRLLCQKTADIRRLEQRLSIARVGLEVVIACGEGKTGDAILAQLLDSIMEAPWAKAAAVFAFRDGVLKLMTVRGEGVEVFTERATIKLGQGPSGLAAKRKEPVIINKVAPEFPSKYFVAVPLLAGDELIGTLEIVATDPLYLTGTDLKTLMPLGSLLSPTSVAQG